MLNERPAPQGPGPESTDTSDNTTNAGAAILRHTGDDAPRQSDQNHAPFTAPEMERLCPKFARCSAPWCPGLGGSHLKGEAVCHYLREAVKPEGEDRIRESLPARLAGAVFAARTLLVRQGPLTRALQRASQSGSKQDAGHRLRGEVALAPRRSR